MNRERDLASFLLLLSVLGSVVFLAYSHIIPGDAAVAIISSLVTLAGGALAVHSGVTAGVKAANGTKPKP